MGISHSSSQFLVISLILFFLKKKNQFSVPPIAENIQYLSFCVWLPSLAYFLQGSSMLQHVPGCHSSSGGVISLDTRLLHHAYGLGSPPLVGTGADPVLWICDWGHYEHCVQISVASLLPDPMATLLSSLTPRQNIGSVVSAATIAGVEQHLLWLCFHLPGGWWPRGHEHSAFGSRFGRNV